jgi:hypothetical protein
MKEKDCRKIKEIQETLNNAKADWEEYQRHTDTSERRLRTAVSFAWAAYDKLGHIKKQLGPKWVGQYKGLLKNDTARFLQSFRNAIQHDAVMPHTGWSLYIDNFNTDDIREHNDENVIGTVIGDSASNGGNYQIIRTPDGEEKKRYFSIPRSSSQTYVEDKIQHKHILEHDFPLVINQLQSLIDDAYRILE